LKIEFYASKETGEIIGIAQKIIPSYTAVEVPEKAQKRVRMPDILEGTTQIGIVWGDTFHRIKNIPNMTNNGFGTGILTSAGVSLTRAFVNPEFKQDNLSIPKDLL